MADPLTMTAIIAVTAMAAGTVVQTVGAIREGQQISATERYNARVAEAQSQAVGASAAFESEVTKKQSAVERAKIARQKATMLSTQRATYAKAGVRLDVGSPLEVMADTATQYELDLAANRYNLATGLEKLRYESEIQRSQLSAEAQHRRQLAQSAKTASYLKAGSTILTSTSKAAAMFA